MRDANVNDKIFGWIGSDGMITALIIYSVAESRWLLYPCADLPQARWPQLPADDAAAFDAAVQENIAAGNIVDLIPLLAATKDIVSRVPVPQELGSAAYTVLCDLPVTVTDLAGFPPDSYGFVLPAGRYGHHRALRAGAVLPSLDDLRADPAGTDVGSRFRPAKHCG